jgi:hypothetical protein
MIRSLRTSGRVLAVSALTVGTLPLGSAVHADAVRTETKLAGFSVTVEASPLRVLIDDSELQIPHPSGTAVLEGDPNYTLASVSAGPNARALTSTFWPGNLLGEGLPALAQQQYPLKGEARYPDKPYDQAGVDGGQLSGAHAEGLDAVATADGTPVNKPGAVMVGKVTSKSTASVTDKDVATGTALSAASDINLLGLIRIGAARTVLTSLADGKKASAAGTTTVTGLTIANNDFSVDDKGLHAGPQSSGLPALDTPPQVSKALGITAHVVNQTQTTVPGGVNRVAGGLVIDIDTGPLRQLLTPVTGKVNPLLNQLIASLPDKLSPVSSQLYYLVKATPHITFILASANAGSAATLPLTLPPFEFPAFPSTPGGFVSSPGSSGSAPLPDAIAPGGAVGTPPLVGGTPGTGVAPTLPFGPGADASASTTDAGFSGIGPGWLLGAFLGAGLIGWGLVRFLGLAGGALLGAGCRLGAPTSVPNLRSVTA